MKNGFSFFHRHELNGPVHALFASHDTQQDAKTKHALTLNAIYFSYSIPGYIINSEVKFLSREFPLLFLPV
jgi:hypothetical protein